MLEIQRYVNYLQRTLADDLLPEAHDNYAQTEWVIKNHQRLQHILANYPITNPCDVIEDFESYIFNYNPASQLDTAFSSGIFVPLVQEIAALAAESGVGISKIIIVSNLPDVGIGPLSRPSTETPMIFAGLGTSVFCNYWSKIYSTFFTGLAATVPQSRNTAAFDSALLQAPLFLEHAVKLSLYFAHTNTVLCFGQIVEPAIAYSHRIELLKAMEVFVVAHEFAHLYLEEKNPELQGISEPKDVEKLEFDCDMLAFSLCRTYGAKTNNWSAFCGSGAYLFFEAVKTCYYAREFVCKNPTETDGHPSPQDRQRKLFDFSIASTNLEQKDEVNTYMMDLELNTNQFSNDIRSMIKNAFALKD